MYTIMFLTYFTETKLSWKGTGSKWKHNAGLEDGRGKHVLRAAAERTRESQTEPETRLLLPTEGSPRQGLV